MSLIRLSCALIAASLCLLSSTGRAEIVVLPQVVDGPTWTTTVRIINLFQQDQRVSVKAVRSDGSPWIDLGLSWRFSGTYEPDANGEFDIGVQANTVMEVNSFRQSFSSDPDTDVTGYLLFDINTDVTKVSAFLTFHPGGTITSRVGILGSSLMTLGTLPFDKDTAIAIMNPNTQASTVEFQVVFSDIFGSDIRGRFFVELEGNGHSAFFLTERIPPRSTITSDFFGYINISSGSEFSAIALVFRPDGVMTSLPIHPMRADIPDEFMQ